ncbi:MAG: serine/threonine-protein kinase [Pseudomonadota bacterium]
MSKIQTGTRHSRALQTGADLPSYRIERVLGVGGFGITYLARHETLKNKLVAIKEYLPSNVAYRDDDAIIRLETESLRGDFEHGLDNFFREATNLFNLTQGDASSLANVVKVEDVFRHQGTAYMVMEYIDGDSLESMIESMESSGTKLSEERLRQLILQLGAAVQFMHDSHLLHRDITPSNVIIRRSDDTPVLIDFGSAKHEAGVTQAFLVDAQPPVTQHTRVVFTPRYSPLEQSEGLDQDARTDIYSLAATMYHLALRQAPVPANKRRGTLEEGQPDPNTPALQAGRKAGYSVDLLACIDAGLALRMRDRPASVGEWLGPLGLEGASSTITNSPSTAYETRPATAALNADHATSAEPATSGSRKRLPIILGAVAVAIIVGGWQLSRPSIDGQLDEVRAALAQQPFATETLADARKIFMRTQLNDKATPGQLAQARAGVTACDLLGEYRGYTQAGEVAAAGDTLNELETVLGPAGLPPAVLRQVSEDYDFEAGLVELGLVLERTGLGADLAGITEELLASMQPAGAADARFESASSTAGHVVEAARQLESHEYEAALASVAEAESTSAAMGLGANVDLGTARGVIDEARNIYGQQTLRGATAALAGAGADAEALASAQASFAEAQRVLPQDARARVGRQTAAALLALSRGDDDATTPDALLETLAPLAEGAYAAGLEEPQWAQLTQAFRGLQQERTLIDIERQLIDAPLESNVHTRARGSLRQVIAEVREHELAPSLITSAEQRAGAVDVLATISAQLGSGEFDAAAASLEQRGEVVRAGSEDDRLLRAVAAATDRATANEIERRAQALQESLGDWRPPDVPRQARQRLEALQALAAQDARALSAQRLLDAATSLLASAKAKRFDTAFAALEEARVAANELDIDQTAANEQRQWLQAQTDAHVTEELASKVEVLRKSPLANGAQEQTRETLEKMAELLTLADLPRDSLDAVMQTTGALAEASTALERSDFLQADTEADRIEALANSSALALDGVLGALRERIQARRASATADTDKLVRSLLDEVHGSVSKSPIDLAALAAAEAQLETLDERRENPQIAYDWSGVDNVQTTLGALAQARRIANNHDYVRASTLLVEVSVALPQSSRWRALLTSGTQALATLRQETLTTLLRSAGDRLAQAPFDSAAWSASRQDYRIVAKIEAADDAQGALGQRFIDFLEQTSGPMQREDYVWMRGEGSTLATRAREFARLPSALKTSLAIARDIDKRVTTQDSDSQSSLDRLFATLEVTGELDQYDTLLADVAGLRQEAQRTGQDPVVIVYDVLTVHLKRFGSVIERVEARELIGAKEAARQLNGEGLDAVAGTAQLAQGRQDALSKAHSKLVTYTTGESAKSLVRNNRRLSDALDELAIDPFDAAAQQAARQETGEILRAQADLPDALTALSLLDAIASLGANPPCEALDTAREIVAQFRYISANLSWLDPC